MNRNPLIYGQVVHALEQVLWEAISRLNAEVEDSERRVHVASIQESEFFVRETNESYTNEWVVANLEFCVRVIQLDIKILSLQIYHIIPV